MNASLIAMCQKVPNHVASVATEEQVAKAQ